MITIPNFKGESDFDITKREEFSTDASVFKVMPAGVLYPTDTDDVVALVHYAREQKKQGHDVSLSVRAGGTCMSGGSLSSGYILNLEKHMKDIVIDPVNQTATVGLGAYFRDIEAEALKHDLMFAPYPSSKNMCGIGGMIGNNASGEKSLRHGATIDNVLSLEVVLGTGEVVTTGPQSIEEVTGTREKSLISLYNTYAEKLESAVGNVSKVASGYRLERIVKDTMFNETPLFVGAQATLGIITKAVLKLVPIHKNPELLLIPIDSIDELPSVLKTALSCNPECVETFDVHTFERARKHLTADAERIEFCFEPHTQGLVLVQFSESTIDASKKQAQQCKDMLDALSVRSYMVDDEEILKSAWEVRRHSFSLMRDNNEPGVHAVPCIEDAIVPIESFSVFVPKLVDILNNHNVSYGYHGHIGEGALRIIPLFDFRQPDVAEKIISFTREVIALIKSLKGNMSADHSDGIIRSPFLKEFYGEELYETFSTIKQMYDPDGILNPHKKIDGTEDNIKKYLNRS